MENFISLITVFTILILLITFTSSNDSWYLFGSGFINNKVSINSILHSMRV